MTSQQAQAIQLHGENLNRIFNTGLKPIELCKKLRRIQGALEGPILQRLEMSGGLGGRAYWITGQSGTGKTTFAKIIAAKIADRFTTFEFVGRDLTISKLRDYVDMFRAPSLTGKGWALIVNESHGLSKPVIEYFLDMLENLKSWIVIIFTTTNDGNSLFEENLDSSPFASRCLALSLAQRGLCEIFANRAKEIAMIENLDGKPLAAYIELAKKNRNNMRAILNAIEIGAMMEN